MNNTAGPPLFDKEISDILQDFHFSSENILLPVGSEIGHVHFAATVGNPKDNSLLFINTYHDSFQDILQKVKSSLFFVLNTYRGKLCPSANTLVFCENPRMVFSRVFAAIMEETNNSAHTISPGAHVCENAYLGRNVRVDAGAVIEEGAAVGDNTVVLSGAIVHQRVTIGSNCLIRENAVIGGVGFGIEKDEQGNNFHIPQIGGVIIGDHVEVGALSTVASGTIDPTFIDDYVKIDDHVHIGHNIFIASNVRITAGAIIGGKVRIGKNVLIGINATLKNGVTVGDYAQIGMSAVVLHDIPAYDVVMAEESPSMREKIQRLRKEKKSGMSPSS